MHQKGNPVVLYNIWDAGGAKAVVEAGASAVATGSWSMAAAHGYEDGEAMPLDFALRIVERICCSVDVPVTVDFEGGYAIAPSEVAENARRIIRAGAAGINFEDRIIKGEGLHAIEAQAARIKAIKAIANDEGVCLVLNARTDMFLGTAPNTHKNSLTEAQEREAAYAEAGADCFFVPGLTDTALISHLIKKTTLPVNVMMVGELTSVKDVAALGASRISFGPRPFIQSLADLKTAHSGIK